MRVLITGASGFIGQHVVRRLVQTPEVTEIVGFDLVPYPISYDPSSRFRSIEGDVRDYETLSDLAANVDSIIHLAALASVPESILDPQRTHDVNCTGTLNVLEAARLAEIDHVTVASSSAVYGEHPAERKHESLPVSYLSPYAASKGTTEGYALAYRAAYGMSTLALRFFNVFGPGQLANHAYAAVIPRFLDAIKAGRSLEVFGDGEQSRDFVSVHVVADVLVKATLRRLSVETAVNLASGTPISVNRLVSELEKVHGAELRVEYLPERHGDIKHSAADVKLLKELVPDLLMPTFRNSLQEVHEWYLA